MTKLDIAITITRKYYHKLSPSDLLLLMQRELGVPNANTARTYLSKSKKVLADELNIDYTYRKINSGKTKIGRAAKLFNDNNRLARADMVKLLMDELDVSMGSAQVYCSKCCSMYFGPRHKTITDT